MFSRATATKCAAFRTVVAGLAALTLGAGGAARAGDETPVALADLAALERAFRCVVDAVTPSVVSIRALRQNAVLRAQGGAADAGEAHAFVLVNGSGTIIREDGLVLTNEHVVQLASAIDVVLHDGRVLPATVVGADPRSDLAVLRVPRRGLSAARLGDARTLERGQWSVAVGNPYGLGADGAASVSVGVISNLGRRLPGLGEEDDRLYADMIQTTASINPGNSGGPLFNLRGDLIGVVTAVHARTAGDEGAGFAIPITPLRSRIISRLSAGEKIEYGSIGLTVRRLDPAEREAVGLMDGPGVAVERLEPAGPAASAGVRADDVLLRVDGHALRKPVDLVERVGQTPLGERVPLELLRDGRTLTLEVEVARRDLGRVGRIRGDALRWRGLRLGELTLELRERLGLPAEVAGVVVLEVSNQRGDAPGRIGAGDVIEAVQDRAIGDLESFRQRVQSEQGRVELRVRGRGAIPVEP